MYLPYDGLPTAMKNYLDARVEVRKNDSGDPLVNVCTWNDIKAYGVYDSVIKDVHIQMFSEFPVLQNISKLYIEEEFKDNFNYVEEEGKYFVITSEMDYTEFMSTYNKQGIIKL